MSNMEMREIDETREKPEGKKIDATDNLEKAESHVENEVVKSDKGIESPVDATNEKDKEENQPEQQQKSAENRTGQREQGTINDSKSLEQEIKDAVVEGSSQNKVADNLEHEGALEREQSQKEISDQKLQSTDKAHLEVKEDKQQEIQKDKGKEEISDKLIINPYDTFTLNNKYGPHWKDTRPPGLPRDARGAGPEGAAIPYVRDHAQKIGKEHGIPDKYLNTFVKTVTDLAKTESHGTFGLPANNFDARPPHPITARGVFQWNNPCIRGVLSKNKDLRERYGITEEQAKKINSWDLTPRQEIEIPIHVYADIFRNIINAGGNEVDAARGVRLWHMLPKAYKDYLKAGRSEGFNKAWQEIGEKYKRENKKIPITEIIDNHLRNAGMLSGRNR